MSLFFHNRHHCQWEHLLPPVSLGLSLRIFLNTQFQVVTTNCLELTNRWKMICASWAKCLLRPCPALKIQDTCIQFCCLEKHECLLPFPYKSTPNIWRHPHGSDFPSFRIRSLMFSWPSLVPDTHSWRHTCECFSEEQAQNRACCLVLFCFTSPDRYQDRCPVSERFHYKHCRERKLSLTGYTSFYAISLWSTVIYIEM